MRIYVDLFYRNVEGFLARAFGAARRFLPDERWHALVRGLYHRHPCSSPHFHEVPRQFVDYLEAEPDALEDLPFVRELCRFEWALLALDLAEAEPPPPSRPTEPLAQCRFALSPLAWPLHFRYPVHRAAEADRPPGEPLPQPLEHPTWLIAWRDREDRVRVMESNAATARLLARLEAGDALGEAAATLAAELGRSGESVLAYGEKLARQFLDASILVAASR